jgi:lipopolysaccharide/colanic/teichoic acid biosynthesis glycosyltransferase
MVANYLGQPAFRANYHRLPESLKRCFDIGGSTAGLTLLSPLIMLVSLAIKLHSRGPVFCRPKYYKLDDAVFEAFEFRSINKEQNLTRMGLILRSSGLDKVPQLINVLRGDMSLVGPRALLTACGASYRARIDPKLLRNVRPGVVGWAQIHEHANKATHTSDKCHSCIEYDCYYIANRSFLLDMKILMLALFLKGTQT